MNSTLQKTQKRLLALASPYKVRRRKEADDAINAAIDQLVTLRGFVATPSTSLPPPVPTTSIDTRGKVSCVR